MANSNAPHVEAKKLVKLVDRVKFDKAAKPISLLSDSLESDETKARIARNARLCDIWFLFSITETDAVEREIARLFPNSEVMYQALIFHIVSSSRSRTATETYFIAESILAMNRTSKLWTATVKNFADRIDFGGYSTRYRKLYDLYPMLWEVRGERDVDERRKTIMEIVDEIVFGEKKGGEE